MHIQKALPQNLDQLLAIYKRAREYMRQTGNPDQWKDYWPDRSILESDIDAEQLYILCDGHTFHGVFALIPGDDPTYAHIEGSWLNDEPYAAVHRVASAGLRKGVFADCLAWCSVTYQNLRIDTHHNNKVMQHLLEKHGFIKCGTIYLENGEPRIAYHRIK